MAARTLFLAAAFSVFAAVPLAAPAFAQDIVQPEVANSRFQFAGAVNASNVFLRSGPGDNYYPVARLDKGTRLTVVGIRFEWLKIVPPEGTFSVVGKAFIQRDGDSSVGQVTADTLNVRAGSSLVPLKVTVQCKLKRGDTVTIIGEQDDYYQIKPPADAYLYIHQKFVEPVKQIAADSQAISRPGNVDRTGAARPENAGTTDVEAPKPEPVTPIAVAPATQPAGPDPVAERAKAEKEYDRLESAMNAALALPLDQQPLSALAADYEKLLQNDHLPASMRRMADIRLASLRVRQRAQNELLATRRQHAASEARLDAIRTNRETIEARIAAGGEIYTAVGALQASSVQFGGTTLYRVTDPSTGRTLCYVRSNDAEYVKLLGKVIGVKGDLVTDPQLSLRVVEATTATEVDPARIHRAYTAQIIPPSMLVKPQTASTDNN